MFKFIASLVLIIASIIPAQAQQDHSFKDKTNLFLFTTTAASITMDSLSTQSFIGCCSTPIFDPKINRMIQITEGNPLAKSLVQSRQGQAFISASGFALTLTAMEYLHRHNHHRMERVLPAIITATETYFTLNNYKDINRYDSLRVR